jgi:hypothetical protein
MRPVTPNSDFRRRRGKPRGATRADLCAVSNRPALARYLRRLVHQAGGTRALARCTQLHAPRIVDYLHERRGEMSRETRQLLRLAVWRVGPPPAIAEYDRLQKLLNRAVAAAPPALPAPSIEGRVLSLAALVGSNVAWAIAQPRGRELPFRLWPKIVGKWIQVSARQGAVLAGANPDMLLQTGGPAGSFRVCFLSVPRSRPPR